MRLVSWQWHEWALEYALKDVYIRRWKGGEVSIQQTFLKILYANSCIAMG